MLKDPFFTSVFSQERGHKVRSRERYFDLLRLELYSEESETFSGEINTKMTYGDNIRNFNRFCVDRVWLRNRSTWDSRVCQGGTTNLTKNDPYYHSVIKCKKVEKRIESKLDWKIIKFLEVRGPWHDSYVVCKRVGKQRTLFPPLSLTSNLFGLVKEFYCLRLSKKSVKV